jgi:adenine-specific DNA-methyltransferase
MSKKQKLELNWVGKEMRPRLEPRILIEDDARTYHASTRLGDNDLFDNILIHGDNLLALKALEADFTGTIKCVFLDPPYNTGSAFTHYDDGLEHSIWLGLMRDRLEIIRRLLHANGSMWITIDDNEGHYLKVLCDEIFGRASFVGTVVWENFYGRSNAAALSPGHNYILVYSPQGADWKHTRNLLPRDEKSASKYKNADGDPRGAWRLGPIFAAEERHAGLMYTITTPSGRKVAPPKGSHWRMVESEFWRLVEDRRISFGDSGDNNPALKLYLKEVQDGMVPRTWWPHTEVGHTQEAKREIQALFPAGELFDTPKPERLLQRIVTISTNPGDIVLDSFAGSGTTGAVAHKMGRRWIMVELGDHCATHVVPRLRQVVDGSDAGGISKAVDWKGGGGFRYFELAPSLLEKDKWGREIIAKEYNPAMLAQALCKLEGFTYAPSSDVYWQQGYSSETDFLYVTTQTLGNNELSAISAEVGDGRSLLILCAAFKGNAEHWPNLTVRKIPNHIRNRCEWGHDDYSLNVANLPQAVTKRATAAAQPSLFDEEDAA